MNDMGALRTRCRSGEVKGGKLKLRMTLSAEGTPLKHVVKETDMSFAQTLMHYKLGHHPMGGRFFRNHLEVASVV